MWPFKKSKTIYTGTTQIKPNHGQGPWSQYYNNYVPRQINVELMEVLRESIPVVDAAINRLVSLDGHVEVIGDNDKLVDELTDFIDNVPVNGLHRGLQKWHQNMTDEAHEQGFSLSEMVLDRRRSGIVELRTADSKFIKFKRREARGGYEILQRSDDDHDYRSLNPSTLLYYAIHNENQGPYGIPLMRSCEFVAKILQTIQHATLKNWERFGDPSFSVVYKTSSKDGKDHEARAKKIMTEIDTANRAKKDGKSVDFVRAVDKDSDIAINVLGAGGQVLEMEIPARHVLEQIIAKTSLPPWMLGMHWSTSERLSNAEQEMLLGDVTVRRKPKVPLIKQVLETELRLRGRTWKKGDWDIKWAGVNLRDAVQQAQARFLNAQADMYDRQNETIVVSDNENKGAKGAKSHKGHRTKSPNAPWPEIDVLISRYHGRLVSDWAELHERVSILLQLAEVEKDGEEPVFKLPVEARAQVEAAVKVFVDAYGLNNLLSPLPAFYGESISAGYLRAANGQPLLNIVKNRGLFDKMNADGFKRVKNNATSAIRNKILPEMEAHSIAGSNPRTVASRLKKLFGDANADWERLARSEMAMAGEKAKNEEWKEEGLEELEFSPNPDACTICLALAGVYPIDECPVPVEDTHPNCRCATMPGPE